MTTAVRKLEDAPLFDIAILLHEFAPHGRDYVIVAETNWTGGRAGRYQYRFTHVVVQEFETRVRDDVWQTSWDDVFTDYDAWQRAGEPDGYVWGTCWSLAYPGQTVSETTERAKAWSRRVGQPMVELELETDRFRLTLVFHGVHITKLRDEHEVIDRATIPLSE